jgi:hypothetical protein
VAEIEHDGIGSRGHDYAHRAVAEQGAREEIRGRPVGGQRMEFSLLIRTEGRLGGDGVAAAAGQQER